jgi:cell division protease FtsH
MVARFGMSESIGLAAHEAPRQSLFLELPSPPKREYSEATARLIDQEIRGLLDEAHARVLKTLSERKSVLATLARMLMEREVVDGAELRELLGPNRPSDQASAPKDKLIPETAGAGA